MRSLCKGAWLSASLILLARGAGAASGITGAGDYSWDAPHLHAVTRSTWADAHKNYENRLEHYPQSLPPKRDLSPIWTALGLTHASENMKRHFPDLGRVLRNRELKKFKIIAGHFFSRHADKTRKMKEIEEAANLLLNRKKFALKGDPYRMDKSVSVVKDADRLTASLIRTSGIESLKAKVGEKDVAYDSGGEGKLTATGVEEQIALGKAVGEIFGDAQFEFRSSPEMRCKVSTESFNEGLNSKGKSQSEPDADPAVYAEARASFQKASKGNRTMKYSVFKETLRTLPNFLKTPSDTVDKRVRMLLYGDENLVDWEGLLLSTLRPGKRNEAYEQMRDAFLEESEGQQMMKYSEFRDLFKTIKQEGMTAEQVEILKKKSGEEGMTAGQVDTLVKEKGLVTKGSVDWDRYLFAIVVGKDYGGYEQMRATFAKSSKGKPTMLYADLKDVWNSIISGGSAKDVLRDWNLDALLNAEMVNWEYLMFGLMKPNVQHLLSLQENDPQEELRSLKGWKSTMKLDGARLAFLDTEIWVKGADEDLREIADTAKKALKVRAVELEGAIKTAGKASVFFGEESVNGARTAILDTMEVDQETVKTINGLQDVWRDAAAAGGGGEKVGKKKKGPGKKAEKKGKVEGQDSFVSIEEFHHLGLTQRSATGAITLGEKLFESLKPTTGSSRSYLVLEAVADLKHCEKHGWGGFDVHAAFASSVVLDSWITGLGGDTGLSFGSC